MSDDREFLRATTDWLEAGSDRTPPRAIDGVLLAIRTTRQERVLPNPWRNIDMNALGKALIAATAVVAIALAWINFGPSGNGVGVSPTPSPTPTPMPTPTPTPRPVPGTQLSPLDPGTRYVTAGLRVRLTFAVPPGWVGNIGGPNAVWLGPSGTDEVVWFQLFDKVYADPCHYDQGPVPSLGPSADDLANALASLPGLDATTPTTTTFSGLPATMLTLTGPASVAGCTDGVFRVWELPLGATLDMAVGEVVRIWIVDVDGERLVVSTHELRSASSSTSQAIQQVIDSILIEHSN